jgi:hypothetical protein
VCSMFLGPEPKETRIKSRSQKRIETKEETSKKHRKHHNLTLNRNRPTDRQAGRR